MMTMTNDGAANVKAMRFLSAEIQPGSDLFQGLAFSAVGALR